MGGSSVGSGVGSGLGAGCGALIGVFAAVILIPLLLVGGCVMLVGIGQQEMEREAQRELTQAGAADASPVVESPPVEMDGAAVAVSPVAPANRQTPEPSFGIRIPPPEETLPEVRTWTSANGKYTVEAEFRGVLNGTVSLRKRDGTVVKLPVEKLSQADRDWIGDKWRLSPVPPAESPSPQAAGTASE